MKRFSIVLLVLVMLMPMVFANAEAEKKAEGPKSYKWAFSMAGTEETLNYKGAAKFKELVEARTNGQIKVDLYANSALGTTAEMMEGHINGTIPLLTGVTSMLPPYVPGYALFDLPAAFPDIATLRAFEKSDFIDILNKNYAKSGGFYMLGFSDAGFRQLTSNKKVHSVADMQGMKIRVQENKYHLGFWNSIGANAIAMDYTELYTNLQQGVIDAEENPYMNFYDSKLYEVQKYVIETNHIAHVMTFSISTNVWESLTPELQKIVQQSMDEAMDFITVLSDKSLEEYKAGCKDKGVEIIKLDAMVLDEIQMKASPVYDMVRKDIGDEIVNQFLDAIKNSK